VRILPGLGGEFQALAFRAEHGLTEEQAPTLNGPDDLGGLKRFVIVRLTGWRDNPVVPKLDERILQRGLKCIVLDEAEFAGKG